MAMGLTAGPDDLLGPFLNVQMKAVLMSETDPLADPIPAGSQEVGVILVDFNQNVAAHLSPVDISDLDGIHTFDIMVSFLVPMPEEFVSQAMSWAAGSEATPPRIQFYSADEVPETLTANGEQTAPLPVKASRRKARDDGILKEEEMRQPRRRDRLLQPLRRVRKHFSTKPSCKISLPGQHQWKTMPGNLRGFQRCADLWPLQLWMDCLRALRQWLLVFFSKRTPLEGCVAWEGIISKGSFFPGGDGEYELGSPQWRTACPSPCCFGAIKSAHSLSLSDGNRRAFGLHLKLVELIKQGGSGESEAPVRACPTQRGIFFQNADPKHVKADVPCSECRGGISSAPALGCSPEPLHGTFCSTVSVATTE